MWRCSVCGFVWEGEEPPDECPNCGSPRDKYAALDDKAMELVERSRFTNGLHMQLNVMMEEVAALAEEGIEDNLDPSCVKIFTRALEQAELFLGLTKSELQKHMNKGKWG